VLTEPIQKLATQRWKNRLVFPAEGIRRARLRVSPGQLPESLVRGSLIIFDTFVQFFDGGDEQSVQEARKFTEQMQRLVNLGATVLVMFHAPKGCKVRNVPRLAIHSRQRRAGRGLGAWVRVEYERSHLGAQHANAANQEPRASMRPASVRVLVRPGNGGLHICWRGGRHPR
jgi:hypothetical protein